MTKQIVIVGGGAGGLELATRLGKTLGKKNKAKIILVDLYPTHIWKPLLHEVAAGTLDANEDQLNYFAHASKHHFYFELGEMIHLNRQKKEISLAPIYEDHKVIIPQRTIKYDILVLAFGSLSNDLGIKGVRKHCLFLDERTQADRFQQLFFKHILRKQNQQDHSYPLNIAIIGAGATGVELAAELHYTLEQVGTYGLDNINTKRDVKITLIEAADRILPGLPERVSDLTTKELHKLGIEVLTDVRVKEVEEDKIITVDGKIIPVTLVVWSAGIKGSEQVKNLDGLEFNHLNQLLVKQTLQTTKDENIFAMGDCASCPRDDTGLTVPPRAQAASQQATTLAKSLAGYIQGKPLLIYHYKDYGSLISLSKPNTVGDLMGFTKSFLIEGTLARLAYLSLYKKHQAILHGGWRVLLLTLASSLTRKIKPRLKLH